MSFVSPGGDTPALDTTKSKLAIEPSLFTLNLVIVLAPKLATCNLSPASFSNVQHASSISSTPAVLKF